MITRKALVAAALATTCLAPLAAFAQAPAPGQSYEGTLFTGDIGAGLMGVMGSNPNQAGRYTGLNTSGLDVVTQFHLHSGDAWDSGGTRYYDINGDNLIFQTGDKLGYGAPGGAPSTSGFGSGTQNTIVNNGSVGLEAGDQGLWGLAVHYNAITYTGNVIDSLYHFNGSSGALNNNLLPFGGSTGASAGPITSFTVPSLNATGAMKPFQTGTRRDIVGGEGTYHWGDWTFTLAARHEHKEGSMEESASVNYGGSPFALPINSDTDRYDAKAEYTTRAWQGVFQYTFSHYSDNMTFVTLPYPVSGTAAPFQRQAAYSTPPSNEAHYLTVLLSSNEIIPKTRLNFNFRVGLEKQDDNFPINTADPVPSSIPGFSALNSQLQGTTANSLNAIATVYQLKISANSHPFKDVDTNVYYGLDARNVSLNQRKVTTGGTGGYSTDSTLVGTEFVVPQEWLKQNAGGEVGYRILPESNTKLTVGYRFDSIGRSNAQVGHSYTNSATVAVLSDLGTNANGKLSFEYSDRSGQLSYLTPWYNLDGPPGSPTYSGAYYQAPMTSESVTARADYSPLTNLSSSLFVQFRNEDYNYPATNAAAGITPAVAAGTPPPFTGVGQGIKSDYALVMGPDINYRPTTATNIHFFYTYELLFYDNRGNGACATLPLDSTCTGSIGYFKDKYTSGTHTVGVNSEWQVNEKLKLKADYTFSYGSVMFSQFNGVFVKTQTAGDTYQNVTNFPDTDSRMHNLVLTATYQLAPKIELGLQAFLMNFHNNDWRDQANAIQGAGTSAINILTPGYQAPNYTQVGIVGGVKVKL